MSQSSAEYKALEFDNDEFGGKTYANVWGDVIYAIGLEKLHALE